MLQRIGISMTGEELRSMAALQKRLGLRSRSEFFREIVRRYEKLEREWRALRSCLDGYLEHPESKPSEQRHVLKAALKGHAHEDWA